MRTMAITFLAAFLGACMPPKTLGSTVQKNLDATVGTDVNSEIMRLGPPSNVYTMPNGNKMYSWLMIGGSVVTTNYTGYLNAVTARETTTTRWCQLTFVANPSDVIQTWQAKGNSC